MPSRSKLAASVLAAIFMAVAAYAQTASQTPTPAVLPACATPSSDPRLRELNFPSYLEDSPQQIRAAVPSLHNLKFDAQQNSDLANSILEQTGEIITTMVPRVPNLLADEQLSQTRVPLPYTVLGVAQSGSAPRNARGSSMQSYDTAPHQIDGEELQIALHTILASARRTTFTYRISAAQDPVLGAVLDEYRVDAENHPVVLSDSGPGSPQAVGFGSNWLLFRPDNLPRARFRYLGRQKIDGHEAHVLAFAQIPELVDMPAQLGLDSGRCAVYFQGIVWIDGASFQIVRLQTDLLSPIRSIDLTRLRSEIRFTAVRIEQRNLTLWLPSDVEIIWTAKNAAGGELHRYSRYRLFGATSRIIPN